MALSTREGRYHDRHLLLYSAVFWPWHLNRCRDSCQILSSLWEAFVPEVTFQHWIVYHCQRVQTARSKDTFWLRSRALQREGRDRLSTVCMFGLGRKLISISKSQFGWMARIKLTFYTTFISKPVQRGHADRLLLCASTFGDLDIAQHLLDAGVGVSMADDHGWTPLHRAAQNGHEELAWLLVDRGAEVSAADRYGSTPLHDAFKNGHEALARLLIDRGADISAANGYSGTPLHRAAQSGHEALAQLLVDRGADDSAADGYGWPPLHRAAAHGHEALARLLLDRGADVSAVDGYGRTPLHIAAENRHTSLARLLAAATAPPFSR